ncbi:MAG: hypothetical protein JEZ11_09435 [Desulfobacterales bacterium]|nr:hypothetical protein [Desulfobacterales bacterium]
MFSKTIRISLITIVGLALTFSATSWAGNKKIMSIRAAKVLAERALVESVYGLKVRATEEVQDMVAASFVGTTESKTSAMIKGIKFEEVIYDAQKDIAKVTASVSLPSIENIDGNVLDLKGKVFRRVAFATSSPAQAGPLKALRAAELDAYKQLVKEIVGFTLESQTTVENYMLKSDTVKTKVLATMYQAQVTEFGWDDAGDAFVKMALNVSEISDMLGEPVVSDGQEIVEVEGMGAQQDDFSQAKTQ